MQYITHPDMRRSTEARAQGQQHTFSPVLWSSIVNKIRNKRQESRNNSRGNRISYILTELWRLNGTFAVRKDWETRVLLSLHDRKNQKHSSSLSDSATFTCIPVQLAVVMASVVLCSGSGNGYSSSLTLDCTQLAAKCVF